MPQGLQVWDAAGNLILDTSTLVWKEFSVATVTADGQYVLPAAYANSVPLAVSNADVASQGMDIISDPDNHKVVWKFGGGGGSGNARLRVAMV